MPQDDVKTCFYNGLQPAIRDHIHLDPNQTAEELMEIALRVEFKNFMAKRNNKELSSTSDNHDSKAQTVRGG